MTGGLSNSDGLCARLASLSGVPVVRPVVSEATARGTAFWLAGAPGDWPDTAEPRVFEPSSDAGLTERYERWRSELENALS